MIPACFQLTLLRRRDQASCTNRLTPCAKVGETLNKHCVVTGLPQPNVTVSKVSGRALSTRLPLADRSGLTFSGVALTDIGTYRLAAKKRSARDKNKHQCYSRSGNLL